MNMRGAKPGEKSRRGRRANARANGHRSVFSLGFRGNVVGEPEGVLQLRIHSDPDILVSSHNSLDAAQVNVFSHLGFIRAWWKAYGKGKTLHVVEAVDSLTNSVVIAPFYSSPEHPTRWMLIGDRRADYCDVASVGMIGNCGKQLYSAITRLPGWWDIAIDKIPVESPLLYAASWAYGPNASIRAKVRAWTVRRGPLAYIHWHERHPRIEQRRILELRGLLAEQSHRKHVNWFLRRGKLEYRRITVPEEVLHRLPAFFALHVNEWHTKGGRSLFDDASNRNFYRFLIDELGSQGAIRLDTVELSGRIIAAHFGFEWRERAFYYKPCYDPEFASHSPGKLLLAYIIEDAANRGLEEVDLLYGLEPYKLRYASSVRATASLLLQRSRIRAAAKRIRGVARALAVSKSTQAMERLESAKPSAGYGQDAK